GDMPAGQNLRLRHDELLPFALEHRAHTTEITDLKTQIADAELFLQTDETRRGHLLGVHELHGARAVAQPMDSPERGLHLLGLQTQGAFVEAQTFVDIADED